jgi:hypothetical protein
MTNYILRRLGQGLLTVFLTVSTVFVLIRMAPGDPAVSYAGPLATTEQLAKVREQFGLDLPLLQQYWIFLQQLFSGNLGTSYSFQAPAMQVVAERMPYTLTLATASILLTAVVAIPLGVWMSRRPDTKSEFGVNVLTIAGQSMPDFWTGIMLLTGFAVIIPIFPASGFTTWGGLVLPTVTIAILQIALISRMVRREMTTNFAAPLPDRGPFQGRPELPPNLAVRHGQLGHPGLHGPRHPLCGHAQRRGGGGGGVRLARRRFPDRPGAGNPRLPADPGHRPAHGAARGCCPAGHRPRLSPA